MSDRYLRWTHTRPGRFLTRRLGLPRPARLHRWSAERPALEGGPLLHLTTASLYGRKEVAATLDACGCGLPVVQGVARAGTPRCAAVVLDATGLASVAELHGVHELLHPVVRSVTTNGRVLVLGAAPSPRDHHQAAAQQALEGFVRSLGKELGGGRTAQLVRLAPDTGIRAASSTLGFLLSPRSAYVSGQVIEVAGPAPGEPPPGEPAPGPRTALVTGAARGIGAEVAAVLAREGASVICLDVPGSGPELDAVAGRLGGTPLPLDITAPDAGARIAQALPPGGLDVLVHNAGITRDRRLANMDADRWDAVLDVNLASVLRTTDHLLAAGALREGRGRVVATASVRI